MNNSIKRIQSESLLSSLLSARILRKANKAYQYIALAALALSFAACTQEDDYTPQGNQKDAPLAIASAGVAELTTRATINNNNLEGGSIGVYVNSETGGRYSGDNIRWTYGNDGWQLEDATVVLYENNGEKQQIAAYYPYAELDAGKVQITLPEAYGEDYENYDYLYGEYAQLSDNPATIALNHLMAKVTVNVQATGTELGGDNAKSISLMNVPRTADWTLPGATLSEYGNAGSIDLYYNNGSYCGYALPNEAEALTLRITTESGRTFTATASLDDASTADKTEVLTSGKHYKIGVKVGKDKAEISSVSVADWADGETLDGGVAEEDLNDRYDELSNTYTVYTAVGLYAWSEKVRDIFATGVFNDEINAYEYEEDFPNLNLAADITLTGENNWTPIGGEDEDGLLYYTGTINGGGHTITGLHINNNSDDQGFIGVLGEGGTVKNLTFADAHVTVGQCSGIVVGDNFGTIEDCHVTSGSLTANGDYAGGIVGLNAKDCIVKNCTNAATITVAQGASADVLGGIAGYNNYGIILGCINTGDISSDNYCIGGVLGDNAGIVVACSNKGTVTGIGNTGGIVGRNAASNAQSIGSWTIVTTESDVESDGVGHTIGTVTGCFTGDAATINGKVSEMNAAIATYNETATVNCPYTWQLGTDGYPTLVKSE